MRHRLLPHCLILPWMLLMCSFEDLINRHLCNISGRYFLLWTLLEWCHHLNLAKLVLRMHGAVKPEIDRCLRISKHLSIRRYPGWLCCCEWVLISFVLEERRPMALRLLILEQYALFLHAFIHFYCSLIAPILRLCLHGHIFE